MTANSPKEKSEKEMQVGEIWIEKATGNAYAITRIEFKHDSEEPTIHYTDGAGRPKYHVQKSYFLADFERPKPIGDFFKQTQAERWAIDYLEDFPRKIFRTGGEERVAIFLAGFAKHKEAALAELKAIRQSIQESPEFGTHEAAMCNTLRAAMDRLAKIGD